MREEEREGLISGRRDEDYRGLGVERAVVCALDGVVR